MLAILGTSMGAGFAMVTGDIGHVPELCGAALLMAPASLVTAGIALTIHGWSLRLAVAWGALVVVLIIGLFGGLLVLPQWALNVSPFEHVPALPAASFDPIPIVALSATALLLAAVGLRALDRRDLVDRRCGSADPQDRGQLTFKKSASRSSAVIPSVSSGLVTQYRMPAPTSR